MRAPRQRLAFLPRRVPAHALRPSHVARLHPSVLSITTTRVRSHRRAQEHFSAIKAELRAYSQARDLLALLGKALPLLLPHPQLLEGFAGFIPKAGRPQMQQAVQELQREQPRQSELLLKERVAEDLWEVDRRVVRQAGAAPPAGAQARVQQQQQQQAHQRRGALPQGAAPAGTAQRQPLVQQQAQQARQAQRPGQNAAPSKLQQLVTGAPARQAAAAGPRSGAPQQQQRLAQAGRPGSAASVLMPPRGMQAAMAQQGVRSGGAAGGPGVALPPRGMQAAMQAARPSSAGGAAAGGARPGASGSARPSAAARGPPCPVCGKAPMDAPHEAGCGHSACYTCWLKALAQFRCPTCSRGVRKAQLVKKFF